MLLTPPAPETLAQPVTEALTRRRAFKLGETWLVRGIAEREWLTARGVPPERILTAPRITALVGHVNLRKAAQRLQAAL
jgi:hypothetical protein